MTDHKLRILRKSRAHLYGAFRTASLCWRRELYWRCGEPATTLSEAFAPGGLLSSHSNQHFSDLFSCLYCE